MVGKFLYVVGGYDYNLEEVRQTEKFNVLRKEGKWIETTFDFDEFVVGMALVASKNRFLLAFGGCNCADKTPTQERFARLDTLKTQGWTYLNLSLPAQTQGTCYGVLPALGNSFLVFGGEDTKYEVMNRSGIFAESSF
jgi:hypothetical protein